MLGYYDEARGGAQPLPRLPLESVTLLLMGGTGRDAAGLIMRGDIKTDAANPVWVVNKAASFYQHQLAWNTHDLNFMRDAEPDAKYHSYYRKYNRPVVTLRPVRGLKTLIYPIKEIVEFYQDTYFFASPSYMLAYAAWCGAKRINIFGADFDYQDRTEYEGGRCCMEYWMGRLTERGVKFGLSPNTTLLDMKWKDTGRPVMGKPYGGPLYGYFTNQPVLRRDAEGNFKVDPL